MKLSDVSEDKPKPQKLSQVTAEKPFGQQAMEFVEPTVEMLGTAAGAGLGSFLGPAGTVGGAGLGYGITKEALQALKRGAGYEPPRTTQQMVTEPVKNVLTGATFEAGGRALPEILKGAGKVGASIGDLLKSSPTTKAAKIATESLGPNLTQARQVLKQSSDDLTASQALAVLDPKTGRAVLDAPTAQALLQRAEKRDPEFFTKLFGQQEASRFNRLSQIAGGANQTAAKEARDQMKRDLNERLIPVLKTELEAANIAGQKLPKYQGEAARMGEAAKQKVEDVRRFTAAGGRAEGRAPMAAPSCIGGQAPRQPLERRPSTREQYPTPYRELPTQFGKYTYMGELGKRAEDVATQAAEGSLRFGDARRFAEAAAQSLEAHGLRPLKAQPVVNALNNKLRDPSIAGNKDLETALVRVGQDISKWENAGGVIDAFALDSIRKNSINAVAKELFKDDKKAQKQFAASVLESVKPVIIDAVERAGGTGYREYLKNYSLGEQLISQSKLGADVLALYQSSPKEFVKLIEGNSLDEVEKVFGPGSYNIFKQISASTQQQLGKIAGEVKREDVIKEQAAAGTTRLADVLKTNLGLPRLPSLFNTKITTANTLLDVLEGKVSKETMRVLTNAAKSARNLDELLGQLPQPMKEEVFNALQPAKTAGGVLAGVTPDSQKRK